MIKKKKYPGAPIVGVGVIVFRGDEILLVKRGNEPFKGQWSIPGGKQKISGTVIEAVSRELLEETGIKVRNLEFVDFVDMIVSDDEGKTIYHYTVLDFKANWLSGECRPGDDSEQVEWFTFKGIENLKMQTKTKKIIKKAFEKKNFSQKFETKTCY